MKFYFQTRNREGGNKKKQFNAPCHNMIKKQIKKDMTFFKFYTSFSAMYFILFAFK